jgi:hypothetical protein
MAGIGLMDWLAAARDDGGKIVSIVDVGLYRLHHLHC